MNIIKKLKVGVAFAMLAALVFTTTVNAETSYTQKVKNANDTSYYHPKNAEDRLEALKTCTFNSDDIYDLYGETGMLFLYAYNYSNYFDYYTLYDLKKMADKLNEGIEARYGYFFNQGFMATDDITNPSFKRFFCNCSQSDFDGFVKKCVDSSWTYTYDNKNDTTKYSKTFPGSITYNIEYDGQHKFLIAENIFLK